MSWHAYKEPECVDKPGPVALTIKPRPREWVPLQGDIDMFSETVRVRGKARRAGNGRSPCQALQRSPRARAASPDFNK